MPATSTYPARLYPVRTVNGESFPAGYYSDHADAGLQHDAFDLRSRGWTYVDIAERLGLQHWDHAQAAVRAHGRRYQVTVPVSFTAPSRRRNHVVAAASAWVLARTFGVEVETARGSMTTCSADYSIAGSYPVTAAAAAMAAAGLQVEAQSYNHAVSTTQWKVIYDGSVTGVEAVSPILSGDEGLRQVRVACEALRNAGATPGGGVHVHHGLTDFTAADLVRLATNMQATQRALQSYLPASRQHSQWCAPVSDYEFDRLRDAFTNGSVGVRHGSLGISRYKFFNFQALVKYGTVEFRGHGATLNGTKLGVWIEVCRALVEFTKRGRTFTGRQTVEAMLNEFVAEGLVSRRIADRFAARVSGLHGTQAVTV